MNYKRSSARLCIAQTRAQAQQGLLTRPQASSSGSACVNDCPTSKTFDVDSSALPSHANDTGETRTPGSSPLSSCPASSPVPPGANIHHLQQSNPSLRSAAGKREDQRVPERSDSHIKSEPFNTEQSQCKLRSPPSSPLSSAPSQPDPDPFPRNQVIPTTQQHTPKSHIDQPGLPSHQTGAIHPSVILQPVLPRPPEPPDIPHLAKSKPPVLRLRIPGRNSGFTTSNTDHTTSTSCVTQLGAGIAPGPPLRLEPKSKRPVIDSLQQRKKRERITSTTTSASPITQPLKMAPKRTSRVKVIHSESEDEIVCRLSDANGDAGQEFSDSELTPPPPTSQEARLAQNHLQGKSKAKKASTGEGEEKPVKEKTGKDFENAVGRDQAAGEPVTKPRGKAAAGAAKIKGKGKKSDSSSAANSQRPTPALEGDAQVDPSNSAEGSASPTKKITLKLNVAGSARQTPVMDAEEASKERDVGVDNHAAAESSVAEGDTQSRKKQGKELSKAKTSVTPAPNEDEMKPSKKRKSVSLETESNPVDAASTVVDQQREEGGGAKKLKLSLKARSQGDSRPVKKKKEQKGNTDSPDADGAEVEVKTPAKAKGKAKRAAGDDSNEQGAAPPAQEGEKVVKPNKKAKRIPEDEEDAPTAVRALPKGSPTKKDQVSPDTQSNNGPPQLESPNKKNAQLTVQTSSSPERATLTKSSPTRPLRPLKGKKPRRSQPISDDSDDDGSASRKTKAETSEKQRPKEKDSNGLARSKSTPNLANHNNATAAGSAQKKPLLKKKPVQKPAAGGGTGTPVQANKSSGPRMSLLGNTLAILQGTGSAAGTPKGKDGKKDNEIKKETPRVVRKGGWTDEWVLTAEQRKEFESHKAEREAERKKRDSWRVDPVNLQEAKDTYRVDSMQDRTIQVPGSMGIRTEGMASQAIKSILGF